MAAYAQIFPVRLSCYHLVRYPGTAPAPGDMVYCLRCDKPRSAWIPYFDVNAPSSWCGEEALTPECEYRCTEKAGHGGDHYDLPLGMSFGRRPVRAAA